MTTPFKVRLHEDHEHIREFCYNLKLKFQDKDIVCLSIYLFILSKNDYPENFGYFYYKSILPKKNFGSLPYFYNKAEKALLKNTLTGFYLDTINTISIQIFTLIKPTLMNELQVNTISPESKQELLNEWLNFYLYAKFYSRNFKRNFSEKRDLIPLYENFIQHRTEKDIKPIATIIIDYEKQAINLDAYGDISEGDILVFDNIDWKSNLDLLNSKGTTIYGNYVGSSSPYKLEIKDKSYI